MDAKAMFKVKMQECTDATGVFGNSDAAAAVFAACIIAAAVGNGLEALTKAITDNTEEYRGR